MKPQRSSGGRSEESDVADVDIAGRRSVFEQHDKAVMANNLKKCWGLSQEDERFMKLLEAIDEKEKRAKAGQSQR